jgi:general secretion pathway protein G
MVGGAMRVHRQHPGFTLIELLVVMAIVALLISLAVPRYFGGLAKAKETALMQTLMATRDSIDKFYGDTGKYPDDLAALVSSRYLRSLPVDPITESSATWTLVPPDNRIDAFGYTPAPLRGVHLPWRAVVGRHDRYCADGREPGLADDAAERQGRRIAVCR